MYSSCRDELNSIQRTPRATSGGGDDARGFAGTKAVSMEAKGGEAGGLGSGFGIRMLCCMRMAGFLVGDSFSVDESKIARVLEIFVGGLTVWKRVEYN